VSTIARVDGEAEAMPSDQELYELTLARLRGFVVGSAGFTIFFYRK
jgi:hypothetical protein